jgi:hypothetical protein
MNGDSIETIACMFSNIQNDFRYASQAVFLRLSKIRSTPEI